MPLDLDTAWGLFRALLPESILTAWAMGLLLDAAWHHGRRSTQRRAGWMAALGIVAAGEAVV